MQVKRWLPDIESRSSGGNGGTELNFVFILTVAFACVDHYRVDSSTGLDWCLITGIPASFFQSLSL